MFERIGRIKTISSPFAVLGSLSIKLRRDRSDLRVWPLVNFRKILALAGHLDRTSVAPEPGQVLALKMVIPGDPRFFDHLIQLRAW